MNRFCDKSGRMWAASKLARTAPASGGQIAVSAALSARTALGKGRLPTYVNFSSAVSRNAFKQLFRLSRLALGILDMISWMPLYCAPARKSS